MKLDRIKLTDEYPSWSKDQIRNLQFSSKQRIKNISFHPEQSIECSNAKCKKRKKPR